MDVNTLIVVLIPSILSSAIAITNIVLNYKKFKEPTKDEVWEAALKLVVARNDPYPDDFAETYEELKLFKENKCSRGAYATLAHEISLKRQQLLNKESQRD